MQTGSLRDMQTGSLRYSRPGGLRYTFGQILSNVLKTYPPGRGRGRCISSSFFHEQRQRGSITVEKVSLPNRSDFAVAKESRQTDGTQPLLDHFGVVIRSSEQALAPAVATAKAAAVDDGIPELLVGAPEQFLHVFGGGGGRTA